MPTQYHSKTLDHLGLVAGMYDELEIGTVIDRAIVQDMEKRTVSIGQAVKAMVLNGLGFANKQLYLVPMFFRDKPVERLLGAGIQAEHVNDDVLGRSLDALHAFGVTEMYAFVSCHACHQLELPVRVGHLDGTSFHTDGVYNSETGAEPGVIHVTKGYSRDHRSDLNQVVLDMLVETRAGIPILMKPLSGNSSDKRDFTTLVDAHIAQLKQDYDLEYIVADSALYTAENIQRLSESIKWVSRVPETITEAKEVIQAVTPESMERLDDDYRYQIVPSSYAQVPQRWMVVYSEPARRRGRHAVTRRMLKQGEQDVRAFQQLCRQEFACAPDAEQAVQAVKHAFKVCQLTEETIIAEPRYTGPGRPAKDRPPDNMVFRVDGRLSVALATPHDLLNQKSCFIIATNELDTTQLPHEDLLPTYKAQSHVEKGFKFLKDPMFLASSIYLKKPERIMALLMVMTLCLLVYAALEYRIRHGLHTQGITFPNQQGKEIQHPTARWIFQVFVGIHVLQIQHTKELVLNLTDHHQSVLNLLGESYQFFYS